MTIYSKKDANNSKKEWKLLNNWANFSSIRERPLGWTFYKGKTKGNFFLYNEKIIKNLENIGRKLIKNW